MIEFNELRIAPNGEYIVIDIRVKNLDYFTNVFIDAIYIDTAETYIENGPSSNYIYKKEFSDNLKTIRLKILASELNQRTLDYLYFVHIIPRGIPSPDTPCGLDNTKIVAGVFNQYCIYLNIMNFLREMSETCVIPQVLVDAILKFKGLELSIKTHNFREAIAIWKKYYTDRKLELMLECNNYEKIR